MAYPDRYSEVTLRRRTRIMKIRYFAHHVRHAPREMAALANDVRSQMKTGPVKHLGLLYAAIDAAAAAAK